VSPSYRRRQGRSSSPELMGFKRGEGRDPRARRFPVRKKPLEGMILTGGSRPSA
jgi:hypothetical protein